MANFVRGDTHETNDNSFLWSGLFGMWYFLAKRSWALAFISFLSGGISNPILVLFSKKATEDSFYNNGFNKVNDGNSMPVIIQLAIAIIVDVVVLGLLIMSLDY